MQNLKERMLDLDGISYNWFIPILANVFHMQKNPIPHPLVGLSRKRVTWKNKSHKTIINQMKSTSRSQLALGLTDQNR